MKTCHVLQRTSPLGTPFVGECMLCGQGDLTIKDANKPCENLPRLTEEEALIAAIEGHLPTPPGGGS